MKIRLHCRCTAFSLVEVVLCLGVVSFCLLGLLGLFTLGIRQSRDSTQTVKAAHVMTRLLALRTAQPVGNMAADGTVMALPPFDSAIDSTTSGSPVYLGRNGQVLPSAQDAVFQLNYRVTLSSATEQNTPLGKVSRVWAVISWPGAAPLASAAGSYEISICHKLP